MSLELLQILQLYSNLGIKFINRESILELIEDSSKHSVVASQCEVLQNYQDIPSIQNVNNKFVKEPIFEKAPDSPKKDIYAGLADVNTVQQLYDLLLNFEECRLKDTALNTVLGDGILNPSVMLIGEAPGAEEDEQSLPFVGRSGKLLMQAFESIGYNRKNMFISNTVFWRPPGNMTPSAEDRDLCYPFLHKLITIVKPKLLILVGKCSADTFLNLNLPMGKMRGNWFLSHELPIKNNLSLPKGIRIMPLYHPAYLLRSYTQKRIFWQDLLKIKLGSLENNKGSK